MAATSRPDRACSPTARAAPDLGPVTARKTSWETNWAEHPGETIREALRDLGLTQEQAAEKAGVSQPYLSGLIRGSRAITPRAALHLEAATGISAELLATMYVRWAVKTERTQAA